MIDKLQDKYNRNINYLRLGITDRCNLRCTYCMPEHMSFKAQKELLSYEEILQLVDALIPVGIDKIRLTGGEPLSRRNIEFLIQELGKRNGLKQKCITTNGALLSKHMVLLKENGFDNVNLSLDTLDPKKFTEITRRNQFEQVMDGLHSAISHGAKTKVNVVVMDGVKTDELISISKLAEKNKVGVRFIEEMPFNGLNKVPSLKWNHQKIKIHLEEHFGELEELPSTKGKTASVYKIDGFAGSIGIIPAFSRTFCNSCNRLRITALGNIKTCLYSSNEKGLRELIRSGADEFEIQRFVQQTIAGKALNGFEAQNQKSKKSYESMSEIGG